MDAAELRIEVVYALAQEQARVPLRVPPGTSLTQAVERSGLLLRFAELQLADLQLGVFGRMRAGHEAVADGDRVEIYRPLTANPKDARRRRVQADRRARRQAGSAVTGLE